MLVNGYGRYLEISNNKIYTNAGTYAGGIQLGHTGQPDLADANAHNEFVAIHNNLVAQNAGLDASGGGGIVLGTGSGNYRVYDNFVAANFTAGHGAGIAHIGSTATTVPEAAFAMPTFWGATTDVPSNQRNVGVIDRNTIVFNESFSQGVGTNGGGIFVGGTPPAAGAPQLGSGDVRISNNLIQGNAASGGDGGGVALLGTSGQSNFHVNLYNNVIANNVAAFAGGGISLQDAGSPEIVHNTIVNNDSLSTAGAAFTSPNRSVPMPAGIFVRNGSGNNPKITNSLVWHNRSFSFGPTSGGVQVPGTTATYGLIACTTTPCSSGFWDSGRVGSTSALTMNGSTTSGGTAPAFVAQYVNGDRRSSYQQEEITTILTPAALDEGGNFIRPQFGPLSLTKADDARFSNYHTSVGVAGVRLDQQAGGGYNGAGNVPAALRFDTDGQTRDPLSTPPHRGADQVTGFAASPVANPDSATVAACVAEPCASVVISVLANDTPSPLVVSGVSLAVGGSATTNGSTVTYTPQVAFTGQGSFVYSASGQGGEASASVTVTVGSSGPAPVLSLSPSSLNFGEVDRSVTSAAQVVTVSNTGNAPMAGLSVALAGTDAGEYVISSNGCPATLAAGGSCSVSVAFRPTSSTLGAKLASLNVVVSGPPALSGSVALTGTSLGTGLSVAPTVLAFGVQTVNQASPTRAVTLTNTGNEIAYFTRTASGDTSQFVFTDGCPGMPAPDTRRYVVPGGSCAVNVAFRATSLSPADKLATTTVTPTVGAATTVTLSGTAVAANVTRSPGALAFGRVIVGTTSASQPVTVTNNGSAPVQLSLTFGGTNGSQFSQTGTCPVAPAALASGAACVANVVLTPTGSGGSRNATLTVTPIGNLALPAVTLTGTATAPNLALACPSGCGTSSSTYSFGGVNGSVSATFTLSDAGATAVPFAIGSISVAKTNGGNGTYTITGGTCAVGGTLAVGTTCTITVRFQSPAGFSPTSGRLTVAGTAAGTSVPYSVSRNLTGN